MISPWLSRAFLIVGVITDLAVLYAGVQVLTAPPRSILTTVPAHALVIVWALLLIGGSLACLIGHVLLRVRGNRETGVVWQTTGCIAAGGGFVVWCVAAAAQPLTTPQTQAVAAVLFALGWCLLWRALGLVAGGQIRRTR